MTAAIALTSSPASKPGRSTATRKASRPKLRVLDRSAIQRRARRRNAVLAFVVTLVGTLFLVAVVHARLVESQQDLDSMRTEIADLETEKARLASAIDEASSPALVVERATQLGMVRAARPVFLVAVETPDGTSIDQQPLIEVATSATDGQPAGSDAELGSARVESSQVQSSQVQSSQVQSSEGEGAADG